MNTKIDSTPEILQTIYEDYRMGKYIVNRRYQRKLVWTRAEKQAFIDSIYKRFSVPLILLANVKSNDDKDKYEIIDGLQRMNAFCAFIENEFGLMLNGEERYFDLQTLATTKDLLETGELKQNTPILDRAICREMVSQYQMPISRIQAEEKEIDEIFRRINSYGRRLSYQELRQAGATSAFASLVRQLAAEIRGDSSDNDQLELSKMKNISISSNRLDYGIAVDDIFWVREGIITSKNIRISRDEELISHLIAFMLVGNSYCPTHRVLDKIYQQNIIYINEDLPLNLDDLIRSKNAEVLRAQFMETMSIIRHALDLYGKGFRQWMFGKVDGRGAFRAFQILFYAIYLFISKEHKKIKDYTILINGATNIAKNFNCLHDNWTHDDVMQSINSIQGNIRNAFTSRDGENVALDDWSFEIESLLRRSKIEGSQYDFKMGFRNIQNGTFNRGLVEKCVEILTAEVNKGPHTTGYVLVGIAEAKDIEAYKKFYGITSKVLPYQNTNLYPIGLDNEINRFYDGNADHFIRDLRAVVEKTPVTVEVQSYIMTHLKLITFQGKSILMLRLESQNSPIFYDNELYERKSNDTIKAQNAAEAGAIIARFNNN
jgi:hypothetical protein